ncbi:MAG: N-acetylglucosamine-6-phosphate deacetylase [Planctomycetales bacterium]|nr:N-acetylglucosamine-6-phosphate deacetylase [Planctomycetales bacterium]
MTSPPRPEFFDLQVNGYAGVDFNADDLSPESLDAACRALRNDGVTGILATVITDQLDHMSRRVANLVAARSQSALARELVRGVHIEGPFLNPAPGFAGAHPSHHMRVANVDDATALLDAGEGLVSLVTLAPESDPHGKVTRWLVDHGVLVAAGHTDASRVELQTAIEAGLTLFTHLGNGCPRMLDRHDNIVQRALSFASQLWTCFIADGVHIPLFALRNYLAVTGIDRAVVVTDAVAAAGMGPGSFTLAGQAVEVDESLATWSADKSHLVGSAVTMPRAWRNLQEGAGLSPRDAAALTSVNPLRALNLVGK